MPLSIPQQQIANDPHRFKVAICGRRFGKTFLATNRLAHAARLPNKEVWYVAPSYRMAKGILWRRLKQKLQDLRWVAKANETELTLLLKNNSLISLKGADNPDSLRGLGIDYLVMDEFADIDGDHAWHSVLRPALADRQGGALFIGTPRGMSNWSYELWMQSKVAPEEWASFQYTTLDGGNVPQEEIEAAKRDMDERTFREEFLATFESRSNRVYYAFDRLNNVVEPPPLEGREPLHIGTDFNISPTTAVIFQRREDILYVRDEIRMFSSNTNELVEEIQRRYPGRRIFAYPDPAGKARKTSSSGVTDHSILQNAGFEVRVRHNHTPVRDRVNAVNARLRSSTGQTRLFIAPSCKYTIEGLERQTYKEGTGQPDKSSGWDHLNDALGYCVDYLFPLTRDLPEQEQKFWTHRIA